MNAIVGQELTIGYGKKTIIQKQSLKIATGQITGLIGPNGSGKSMLLKALCGINPIISGSVLINEQQLATMPNKMRAKMIAYLAQTPIVPGDLTVLNLVKMGRYAFYHGLMNRDESGKAQVYQAMVAAKVDDLANRRIDSLSGGQRQRAFIAMTLVHNSPIIMLDEPTTYLDLTHQLGILNLLKELNLTQQKTVVLVLHDLNQAAQYCDQLLCIQDGRIIKTGTPKEVLTASLLAKTFQVTADITYHSARQYPQLQDYETLVQS
ncbi:ABC transporter ATP-binding protein [Lapidilactobacillus bayanensis]|uniref:ABC transporter ATP-binding protein n=1 Tax=Lapidilactobacillus bayanensis TaxID=2485998 RepID=UPI000F772BAE|nr:ABC transporter ATP-binding protein [Lapidilactobacillus bayanensis]